MTPLSVLQLTTSIQQVLEKELEPLVWVVGELADFRQAPQGHVYFELVEKQGNQVQARSEPIFGSLPIAVSLPNLKPLPVPPSKMG